MRQCMDQENISYAKVAAQPGKTNHNINDNTQTTIEGQHLLKPS